MIIKKKKTEIIEEPDLVVISEDVHKDKLEVYKRKKEILVSCEVDGTGNCWHIPIKEFQELVK